MNKQSYITIQGWMVQDLHLKGNLLLVYAIIYGFSQDGTGEFCGSITYLAEWLNATRQTVMNTLSELCDRKLLVKCKQIINGVQIVRYKAVIPTSVPEQPKKKQKVEIDCQSIDVWVEYDKQSIWTLLIGKKKGKLLISISSRV